MTIIQVEVAPAVADDPPEPPKPPEPPEPATDQHEWRWSPDPAEADGPGTHSRVGSGSTWRDNLIRAMAWAQLHGTW